MIYTVTFNPSLDYVVQMETLIPGQVNRTQAERIYPGGKGVNVSLVLKNLGVDSRLLGFSAGFTGREVERMLRCAGCQTDFILLERGLTRINVKIKAGEESEVNGQGPDIPADSLACLFEKLEALSGDDILVLAGSIPSSLPEDIYEQILAKSSQRGIRSVVDATKDLLRNTLRYHPFLIKPNLHELGELFGVTLTTEEAIAVHAEKLRQLGARNVLISMAGDGAMLIDENGNRHWRPAPRGKVVNSVGAGDSMVAGFLAGWLRTGSYEDAFKLSICAGSASAFREGLAEKEDVNAIYLRL